MALTASNLPNGRKFYADVNGLPLAGGKVYFYVPGTTNLTTVYLDDTMATPSINPVVLDSLGTCAVFGVGEYREYVKDATDNLISDSVVVASTPLKITEAMLPVLQAATPAEAEALLVAGGATTGFPHLNIPDGDQTLNVAPVANAIPTWASLNVIGSTRVVNDREFLVNLGLNSSVGAGGTVGNDKVTLYSGLSAKPGTADVWTLNTCLTMEPNSGNYNAQGFELDFNNFDKHIGNNGNLITDFTQPIAQGLTVTGAGPFYSTAGVAVESLNGIWSRGLVTLGKMAVCAYQDWTETPVAIQFDGNYAVAALNLTAVHGNAGCATQTAMFMKNSQSLTWQNGDGTAVITDKVDAGNNRVIGLGSSPTTTSGIILCGNTFPVGNNAQSFGLLNNRWLDGWFTNLRLPQLGQLRWEIGQTQVTDMVNFLGQRSIGLNANGVFSGANFYPVVSGYDLGSSANTWGNIYSTGGVITPSDITLKTNVEQLGSMLAIIEAVTPIQFNWADTDIDGKLHYGFSADDIIAQFPSNFGGIGQNDTTKWLQKDELIAVLWRGIQELSPQVTSLVADVAELTAQNVLLTTQNDTLTTALSDLTDRVTALEAP